MLEIHNFTQNKIGEKLFQRVAETVLKVVGIKDKTEISLAIVGDGRMRKLNKMYRARNRVTDVLSFANKSVIPYLTKAFPRLKKGEKITLSKRLLKELGFPEAGAHMIADNAMSGLATSKCLNTAFLTANNLHIGFLNSLHEHPIVQQQNTIAAKHLTSIVPFIGDVNTTAP